MVVTCSIPNCQSNSEKVKLFHIPPPTEKYYDTGMKWIQSIQKSYPNFSMANNFCQYVCSKHFKDQHFILPDRLMLKSFAIPTVFDSEHCIYDDVCERQINNTAAGMNTVRGISESVNNNVHTNEKNVKVISVPNQSYNTTETRTTARNAFNNTPSIEHSELQEPSKQTAGTSSTSVQTRKRRFECSDSNAKE